MFAEKLSNKDIDSYTENVLCGENCTVISKINKEILKDENENFDSIKLDFWTSEIGESDRHCEEYLTDYRYDDGHTSFFIDKFGMPYIMAYRSYLKNLSIDDNEKSRYLQKMNDYYMEIKCKNCQKTMDEFNL